MISPRRFANAPPELPGLIDASVWIMLITTLFSFGTGRFTVSAWCRDLGPRDDASAWAAVARSGALEA